MAASTPFTSAIAAQHYPSTCPPLPNGSCNFRRLDAGPQPPPVCGCQTFWLDGRHSDAGLEGSWYLCACGHHACFHDTIHDPDLTLASTTHYIGSEDGPRNSRVYPSEQVLRTFPHIAVSGGSSPLARPQQLFPNDTPIQCLDPRFERSQGTPALPSTAPPSDYCNDPVEPAQQGWRHQPQADTRVTLPYMADYTHIPFSATEVNTPSAAGSHGANSQTRMPGSDTVFPQLSIDANLAHSSAGASQPSQQGQQKDAHRVDLPPSQHDNCLTVDLRNVIQSYARRLDVLENSSFSHVPAEELQEKLELVDGRLLELEVWRDDVDADMRMQTHRVSQEGLSQSQSVEEEPEVNHIEDQRMADVEERLAVLENASPSYAYPWEFEVVLLPWGSNLSGMWVTPPDVDSSEPLTPDQAGEEWSGLASPTNSIARDHERKSSVATTWMPTWPMTGRCRLSPKAPGPKSVVFKRLRSRGLVQKITITESGASHIWNTVFNAFRMFLDQNDAFDPREPWPWPEYLGLNQPLVPLRKVRRSSYLRFLDPPDMITPATWSFDFLKSGIFMKTKGTYRLYITTPEAYVQPDGGQWSWSWLRLCGLPRTHKLFDVVTDEQMDDAHEDGGGGASDDEGCWEYHANLDHFPSFEGPSSLFPSACSSQSHGRRTLCVNSKRSPIAGVSPAGSTISLPLTARRGRTHSTTISTSLERNSAGSSSKRRGASFSESRPWSQKRHRASDSPEIERHVACLTPRLSREPRSPSPGYEADVHSSRHYGTNLAQLAYATPHSNNVAAFYTAGGDTEADSDSSSNGGSSSSSEYEWEGVVDDDQGTVTRAGEGLAERGETDASMSEDGAGTSSGDSMMSLWEEEEEGEEETNDIDEDLDDGLTIYEATP